MCQNESGRLVAITERSSALRNLSVGRVEAASHLSVITSHVDIMAISVVAGAGTRVRGRWPLLKHLQMHWLIT